MAVASVAHTECMQGVTNFQLSPSCTHDACVANGREYDGKGFQGRVGRGRWLQDGHDFGMMMWQGIRCELARVGYQLGKAQGWAEGMLHMCSCHPLPLYLFCIRSACGVHAGCELAGTVQA